MRKNKFLQAIMWLALMFANYALGYAQATYHWHLITSVLIGVLMAAVALYLTFRR